MKSLLLFVWLALLPLNAVSTIQQAFVGTSSTADGYFANVVLGTHFDGTNGATTATEVRGKTLTFTNGAALSTAQFKYGTASALFDGSNDYISTADHVDFAFGSGDFTIEFWIYPATLASEQWVVSQFESAAGADTNSNFVIAVMTTGYVYWLTYSSSTPYSITGATTQVTLNAWNHIAAARIGNTARLFVNGQQEGSVGVAATSFNNSNLPLYIGRRHTDTNRMVTGYVDDVRITKGIGRYASLFTPPTVPFQDQ